MATSREHFALDWIESELLETLNSAREGLEAFAEAWERIDARQRSVETAGGNAELRACVNSLHQVHGTFVMLELKGVTLLADHLERLAVQLMDGDVTDVGGACQSLMQGILELPGYIEDLQSGLPDSESPMLPLTNELRQHLGEAPLEVRSSGIRFDGVVSEAAIRRFQAIDGVDKTRKIRAVYQQVLLALLKGGDLAKATGTLRKVARGMCRVCEDTPFEAQWLAFGEFVESLEMDAGAPGGPLDSGAVKLLRRVDSEIREIAQSGAAALQRPVGISLVRQLLDGAAQRGRASDVLDELQDAAAAGEMTDSLSQSGRQALVSAATALREELNLIKDRLDLFARGSAGNTRDLSDLIAPLKQIGSTLSLLGFESSKSIVLDQVDLLAMLVEEDQSDEGSILKVAGALVQVEENLASLTLGKAQVEKITDDAHRAVTGQTREGLENVKQSIVDYVSSQWDVRHLEQTPAELDSISGALRMIPLTRVAELVQRCRNYLNQELMAGHVPSWEELDGFADAISGIDYYLERLASENPGGAEDVLDLVERGLDGLSAPLDPPTLEEGVVEPDLEMASESAEIGVAAEPASIGGGDDVHVEPAAAEEVDVSRIGSERDQLEPALEMDEDADFDLSSELFDELAGDADASVVRATEASIAEPPSEATIAPEPEGEFELEFEADADLEPQAVEEPEPVEFEADADLEPGAVEEPEPVELEADADLEPQAVEEPEPVEFEADADLEPQAVEEPEPLELEADADLEPGAVEEPEPVELEADADLEPQAVEEPEPVAFEAADLEPLPVDDPEPAEITAAEDFQQAADSGVPAQPATAVPSTLVDSFDSDEEIVEIFVEEIDEVLATLDEHLMGWQAALDDEAHQMEIRRAFHTLKGSGRMVGANVLGEMAWSVENMLNRLLDGTVRPTDEFPTVVREARSLTRVLRDAFEQGIAPEMAGVVRVMEKADVLASGGTLEDSKDTDVGAEPRTTSLEPEESNDEHRALFLAEAESHLANLATARRDGAFDLGEEVMRSLHTLSGSSAMAGLGAIGELAAPVYELAQALRQAGNETRVSGEAAEFFRQASEAMSASLEDLKAGREPEDPYQLIAEADRLLVTTGESAGSNPLLALPALNVVIQVPEFLDTWKDGAMDMAFAEDLGQALTEIHQLARTEGHGPLADLSDGLRRAHERFEFESLDPQAHEVFIRAHEQLLAHVDAIAADQALNPAVGLLAALDGVSPRASEELVPGDLTDDAVVEPSLPSEHEPEPLAEQRASEQVTAPVQTVERFESLEKEETAPVASSETETEATPALEPVSERDVLIPEDVDEDIIEVFFEEADELLEALDESINDWSKELDNRLHLENLLRALHTLKGGARLCGLTQLGDRTHQFESFLIEVQDGGRQAAPALFDELHAWYDGIAGLLGGIKAALGAAPEPATGEAEAPEEAAPEPALPEAAAPEPAAPELAAPVEQSARNEQAPASPQRDNVAPLRPRSKPATATERLTASAATPQADRAEPRAPQEMVRVGAGLLESLVNLAGESSIIRARVEQGMSDFTSALDEMETTIERLREQLRRLEIETEAQILFRQERPDGPAYEDFDPLEMDRYSQLQQLSRSLSESASDMLDLKDTLLYKAREAETLLLQQARVNTELQEGLMRSRMVPFSRLLPRLRRTVRQVAKELDKEVELHALNAEGELDRSLLERMVPPLEHMLRNAVDHGVESPEERRSLGKAKAGRIDLRLSREGGDVVIEIGDDGAGIDVDQVRVKAVERGLMEPDAHLRDDEISQFVLAPGFSTAKSVTQISGRGVGMDVVHSEVKQLGGSISIFSQRGLGTRFVLRVPFTVSVNRALMVSVGEDLYAIPLNTIEGIVLLSREELDRLYAPDGNTFEYAGVPYQIQYLGRFLGREYRPQPLQGSVPVVLVRSGEHAVAVHVDGVQGSREIVVKSLGPQFAGVGGISGATILGDGSVVVILDLLALIRGQSGDGLGFGKRGRTGAARTRCVMVVDDSVTVRKVTSRLLERQGMDVLVAKDGVEAVALLQERRPDVMLLDIEMPRMDGFEVLRQVRHDERLRDLPIVMISSRTGTKHQDRAAELGVSCFLGKPFQESDLLGTIDELVN